MVSFKKLFHFPSVLLPFFVLLLSMTGAAEPGRWGQIDQEKILEHIAVLSSDKYEGRAPGTVGETLTTAYIEEQFKRAGLKPGNPDGTYFQDLSLMGITADSSAKLVFTNANGTQEALKYADDFVIGTQRVQQEISIEADVVFVGYGITAPESQWDDFKEVDVKNKIIVVLINDPPVSGPSDPGSNLGFQGKAMTYYGRFTYKVEEAARRGALGCFIVHQTKPAGYGWEVVRNICTGEYLTLDTQDKGMSRCAAEGWITYEKAKALFSLAGQNLDALSQSAANRNFHPVDLNVKASISFSNSLRAIHSKNVIGKLEGSDPQVRDECVIYCAHWDHLGIGPEVNGDRIYHGALDNASGVSGLIELANAFVQVQSPPRRSIVFLAPTAEEEGLLGSQYYAEHPFYPLSKTLAVINMDGLNMLGRSKDIYFVGLGLSTLDKVVREVAKKQGRVVKPDCQPEKGNFFQADHFSFARRGVPALSQITGIDYYGKSKEWGKKMWTTFLSEDWHKPSDTIKPYWDASGTVDDLRLFAEIGFSIANGKTFPVWNPDVEFRSTREAALKNEIR